jgi:hypothetical protein
VSRGHRNPLSPPPAVQPRPREQTSIRHNARLRDGLPPAVLPPPTWLLIDSLVCRSQVSAQPHYLRVSCPSAERPPGGHQLRSSSRVLARRARKWLEEPGAPPAMAEHIARPLQANMEQAGRRHRHGRLFEDPDANLVEDAGDGCPASWTDFACERRSRSTIRKICSGSTPITSRADPMSNSLIQSGRLQTSGAT